MANGNTQPLAKVGTGGRYSGIPGISNYFLSMDSASEIGNNHNDWMRYFVTSEADFFTIHLQIPFNIINLFRRMFWLLNLKIFSKKNNIQTLVYGMNSSALADQIISEIGYVSNKYDHKLKGRIKKLLWGPWLYPYFCPSLLILLSKKEIHSRLSSIIQRMMDENHSVYQGINYLLLLQNKLLGSLQFAEEGVLRNYIVIISRDNRVIQGRRVEKEHLALLEQRGITSCLAPKFIGEGASGLDRYFLTESIDGVIFDLNRKELTSITELGVEQLIAMARETKKKVIVDHAEYENLAGYIFDQARINLKIMDDELNQLEGLVKRNLCGAQITTVLFHGDFKIENIVFSHRLEKINGIIDWEFSRISGLPYLDLWYLISYNRAITTGAYAGEIILDMIFSGAFSEKEKHWINAYHDEIQESREIMNSLKILYYVHHIGIRTRQITEQGFRQKKEEISRLAKTATGW